MAITHGPTILVHGVSDHGEHLAETPAHVLADVIDGQADGQQHESGLQHVGPDDGLDAAFEGVQVKQHQENGGDNRKQENRRHPGCQALGHEGEEHDDHYEHAYGGAQDTRHHKDGCPGLVGFGPEAFTEVGIDRGEIHLVIQRQQHFGNDDVTAHKPQHQRHIEEILHPDIARDGNERDA